MMFKWFMLITCQECQHPLFEGSDTPKRYHKRKMEERDNRADNAQRTIDVQDEGLDTCQVEAEQEAESDLERECQIEETLLPHEPLRQTMTEKQEKGQECVMEHAEKTDRDTKKFSILALIDSITIERLAQVAESLLQRLKMRLEQIEAQ